FSGLQLVGGRSDGASFSCRSSQHFAFLSSRIANISTLSNLRRCGTAPASHQTVHSVDLLWFHRALPFSGIFRLGEANPTRQWRRASIRLRALSLCCYWA